MNTFSKRIIYVDIMRAFAVLMMIQGHTVDTFLADEYRTMDSVIYSIWHTLRGFTAPIFMFTAGLIFTYLLKTDDFEFTKNPRIKKGLKRALMLIGIGYLLRYPTYKIFDFTYVRQAQWDIFFAVDALHLIGFGMLAIIAISFLSKRLHLSINFLISVIIMFLLFVSPIVNKVEWNIFLPQYLSSYLTRSYGSLFPLFPWLVYVLAGGLLGNYLYKNDGIYAKKRFSFTLSTIGVLFIFTSFILFRLEAAVLDEMKYWFFINGMVSLRVGYVILLNGIMAFIVRKFDTIPEIIKETGKKTLMLYVIHVVILYGSAWFPGFYKYFSRSFNPLETLGAVILMLSAMFAIVHFSDKIKRIKKQKIAFNKI